MRRLRMPPLHPRHKEERLKLGAGGCQLIAIALVGAAYIAPVFNPSLGATIGTTFLAAVIAVAFEGAAMWLLRYIQFAP